MNSLHQFFGQYFQLSQEFKNALERVTTVLELKKGEIVVDTGQTCRHMYFIQEGTLRTFYVYDGREITSWFYGKDTYMTQWGSYFFEKQSTEVLEATEATKLLAIEKKDLEHLYTEFAAFEHFARIFSEEQMALMEEFYRGFMFMSAEEKYSSLLYYYPDIEQHVNLGHIASFLGISQETLSRIRKKLI